MKYQTITDVIAYEIKPALGDFVDDFDLDAIADEAFEYVVDLDENGVQHGNGYFIEREGVDFWAIVQKHDISDED